MLNGHPNNIVGIRVDHMHLQIKGNWPDFKGNIPSEPHTLRLPIAYWFGKLDRMWFQACDLLPLRW